MNPNPTVTSFEEFQDNLFGHLNIKRHLETSKITPVRIEIPLCRLRPTRWVRKPLDADIRTVYEGFHIGNWGTNFWVTCCGNPGPYPDPEFVDVERWSHASEDFDSRLKEYCLSDPENKDLYTQIIGRYVNVWDGNHRAIAWMQHIQDNNGEPISVSCFVLNDCDADQGWISNFMRDINEYVLTTPPSHILDPLFIIVSKTLYMQAFDKFEAEQLWFVIPDRRQCPIPLATPSHCSPLT